MGGSMTQVSRELMSAFVRALIRNSWNGDVLTLSMYAAREESGASDEEVELLCQALLNERGGENSMFVTFEPPKPRGTTRRLKP
jgi:protoporphyrinogen oxidase